MRGNAIRARLSRAIRALSHRSSLAKIGYGAAIVVPPLIIGALYLAAESHPLIPGWRGCDYVRDPGASAVCYSRQLQKHVDKFGLDAAFKESQRRAERSARYDAACHMSWHPIGERAGRQDRREKKAFAVDAIKVINFCIDGYGHGYLIGFAGPAIRSIPSLAQLCGRVSTGTDDAPNCAHAIGHVIARAGTGPIEAERQCRDAGTTIEKGVAKHGESDGVANASGFECAYGYWMERTLSDFASGNARSVKPNNCAEKMSRDMRHACAAFLPSRVARITNDFVAAARSCEDMLPDRHSGICIEHYVWGSQENSKCGAYESDVYEEYCRMRLASGDPPGITTHGGNS